MTKEDGTPRVILRTQPFATPEKVHDVAMETYRNIKTRLPGLQRSMSLYLANRDTEAILFRPIKVRLESGCFYTPSPPTPSYTHIYIHTHIHSHAPTTKFGWWGWGRVLESLFVLSFFILFVLLQWWSWGLCACVCVCTHTCVLCCLCVCVLGRARAHCM